MIKIVIVEDDGSASALLKQCLSDYSISSGKEFDVTVYDNAVSFLKEYKADASVVFMDIKMPDMTGMEAAEELRKTDDSVILIFVTDMFQYAVQGYSVNAIDFIIKPITKQSLSSVMDKALRIIGSREQKEIIIKNGGTMRRVPTSKILYIEVSRHRLTYHTEDGDYEGWGSLENLEKTLPEGEFSRCNVGFLVGMRHIRTIDDNDVIIRGSSARLKISRMRKKEFLASVAKYLGRNI